MSIKSILAATILSALFAGTSAIAGDNDHFADADAIYTTATESVVKQKVSYLAPRIDAEDTQLSGRK